MFVEIIVIGSNKFYHSPSLNMKYIISLKMTLKKHGKSTKESLSP